MSTFPAQARTYNFKKGIQNNPNGGFKVGETLGEKNAKWKGDKASYAAKHIWMRYHFGKPQLCEHCGTTEDRKYHWANVSKEYKRERQDWLRLCVPCHKKHDIKALGGHIKPREKKIQPSKVCVGCNDEFTKNPKYSKTQWLEVKFCSRECRYK